MSNCVFNSAHAKVLHICMSNYCYLWNNQVPIISNFRCIIDYYQYSSHGQFNSSSEALNSNGTLYQSSKILDNNSNFGMNDDGHHCLKNTF